jgi:molybdopterin adenylyltransferase
LSTVLGIVQSHARFLQVQSQLGSGTQFQVYLPASEAAETEPASQANQPLPQGRGELMLVVDDEESVRQVTRQILERNGYRVIEAAEGYGWKVAAETIVPDEKQDIQRAIREQIAKGCQLILTTGGTGVALRDATPEAVREIAVRELPGFGEVMRLESMKINRNAILSRNLAAVVDRTLVICLPGQPTGAVECLGFVAGTVPHCIEILQGAPAGC